MSRIMISDDYQQYQYFVTVDEVREYKHVKIETKYQGAKFPDAIQTKIEFFLNAQEYERFKAVLNAN